MARQSWLQISPDSPFSLANIPFGIITTANTTSPRPAIAIGDYALDLAVFASNDGFSGLWSIHTNLYVFSEPTLNAFAALGRPVHREVRKYLQDIFAQDTPHPDLLKENETLKSHALFPLKDVKNHLPLHIGDYTDFYVGKNHALNCGRIFRPEAPLAANYTHLPTGYHGRASSVVVSGTPIRRPNGQILDAASKPTFSHCKKLDFELELGAFVCRGNKMGEPIPVDEAAENVFGLVLMNDWSARDVQMWEMVPLGPFNAKNFGTSVSAWVVLADALEKYRCPALENETQVLKYLQEGRKDNVFDINLEVDLTTKSGATKTITKTNARNLLFSYPQMLAHHSITGCPIQVGDLLGSGTISGEEVGSFGSMYEQSTNGKNPIPLNDGETRTFLEDYDTITFRGWAGGNDGEKIGFGNCSGTIQPALDLA